MNTYTKKPRYLNKKTVDDASDKVHEAADKVHEATAAETSPSYVRRHRAVIFQIGVLALIILFALLTLLVSKTAYFPIDLQITRAIQSVSNPFYASVLRVISWAGDSPQAVIIPAIIVMLLYVFGLRWEALSALVAAVLVSASNLVIKLAIHRPRPAANLVHVNGTFASYSFPSGHVMFYAGFFGFMMFLAFTVFKPSWKRALLLFIFGIHVLLVGFSRMYLGAHWFSDVIGAYLLGGLALIGLIQLYRWGKKRFFVRQPAAEEVGAGNR
jgi:membrane-associated phospholipid phosphatase